MFAIARLGSRPFPAVVPEVLIIELIRPGSKDAQIVHGVYKIDDGSPAILLNRRKNLRNNLAGFDLVPVDPVIIVFVEGYERALGAGGKRAKTQKNRHKMLHAQSFKIRQSTEIWRAPPKIGWQPLEITCSVLIFALLLRKTD